MSEELKHIFDKSACISKRQMKEYIGGMMNREEARAIEHHLTYCEFCNEAIDGLMADQQASHTALDELNDKFIRDFYARQEANEIKNAKIIARNTPSTNPKKTIWLSITGIAAALLIGFAGMRYFDKQQNTTTPIIASNNNEPIPAPETDSPLAQNESATALKTTPIAPSSTTDKETQTTIAEKEETNLVTPTAATLPPTKNKTIAQAEPKKYNEKVENFSANEQKNTAAPTSENRRAKKAETMAVAGARSATPQAENADATSAANEDYADDKKLPLDNAHQLYEEGKYNNALALYKKQMNSSDTKTSQQAKLMAAKCYIALQDNTTAKKLLQQLAEEGNGSERRQAKRLLRKMEQ